MASIRVRELAERCNCSVQNIYNHINKHEEELKPHMHKDRRGTFLDEYACDLIRSYMYPKEVSADTELMQQLNQVRQAYLVTSTELAHVRSELDIANRDLAEERRLLAASNEFLDAQKAQNEEQLDMIRKLEEDLKASKEALKASKTARKAAEDRAASAEEENRRKDAAGPLARLFKRW